MPRLRSDCADKHQEANVLKPSAHIREYSAQRLFRDKVPITANYTTVPFVYRQERLKRISRAAQRSDERSFDRHNDQRNDSSAVELTPLPSWDDVRVVPKTDRD